ncbi:MAG: hypothetical protein J2P36_36285, partial [Ktedonobacteraceae bacterium]|nr:hypothetical protein [Ktedonobacteraceae bacterium]
HAVAASRVSAGTTSAHGLALSATAADSSAHANRESVPAASHRAGSRAKARAATEDPKTLSLASYTIAPDVAQACTRTVTDEPD